MRYFTLTHLVNSGTPEDEIQAFRVGLSKLLNSLSWQKKIVVPQPIDPDKTIFRIDMRKFSWTEATWKKLLAVYPYGVVSESQKAKDIYATTNCSLPYVRADWFVSRAALPPLYHQLLDMPDTADKLEAKLGVDVSKNQKEETAIRAGLQESGVSRNNRVVERHESPYGAYWRSYDFKNNAGKENIFKHPLDFEAAGGEIIFNLPNGLQAYLLVNAKGDRIDTGPIDIVSNKENVNDPVVRNGLTCMSCHAQGMKRFSDNMRAVISAAPKDSGYDLDHALALYIPKTKMDDALNEDSKRFADAVHQTGAEITTREPIYALQGRYDSTLDVSQASAEAGLTTANFTRNLQMSSKLGALLGPLKTDGGRMKRDAWEEYFGDVVAELHLGQYLKPTLVDFNAADPLPVNPGPTKVLRGAKLKRNTKDGAEMVFIPAGEFEMGSEEDQNSKPKHKVMLDGYYISRTPVTVEQYIRFCDENGHQKPSAPDFNPGWSKKDHPIVNVSYNDALAYCAWAGTKLPTEAQWEKAASWDDVAKKKRKFPWGDVFDRSRLWSSDSKIGDAGGTKPVGSFPTGASAYGLLDMAGNVWNWCSDWYDADFYSSRLASEINAENQSVGEKNYRVLRGGSWSNFYPNDFRSASRHYCDPGSGNYGNGFRCVSGQ